MSEGASTWIMLAVAAFASSLVSVWLIERHAQRLRLVDRPNLRSSHVEPRPRGGGLGIVLGTGLAAVGATATTVPLSTDVWVLLAAAFLVSIVGLWDDVRPLSIWPRLVVQTAVAALVVLTLGGLDRVPLPSPADVPLGSWGIVLAVLWLVGVTNFFNFMDGVDGLAAGQAVISLGMLAWALWPQDAAALALFTAAASAAFLIRNWSPAKVFLGDVGSSFLGFILAGLPLTGPSDARPLLLPLVATSLALFLLDPFVTLFARVRRGAQLGAAHREHAYQQFVVPGRPHASAVARLLLTGLALSLLGAAAYRHPVLAWPSIGVAVIAFAVEWQAAARRRC